VSELPVPVLDLEVFPTTISLIFYIACGLFGISATLLLILIGWFLFTLRLNTFIPPLLYTLLGFILGSATLFIIQNNAAMQGWTILVASVFFLVVLIFITISHLNPTFFNNASRLRLLLLFSYITVCLSYVAIYKGFSDRLNEV
ncbi:MAG TPA: hypothetical protein DD671_01190, partial [Balneolaceae bacterium]|nr:hypothetical protein [Balneolaceae bacterium]